MARTLILVMCAGILVLGAPPPSEGQSRPSAKPLWNAYPLDRPPAAETEPPAEEPASGSPAPTRRAQPSAPPPEPSDEGPPLLVVAILASLAALAAALALLSRLAPAAVPGFLPALLRPGPRGRDEAGAGRRGSLTGALRRPRVGAVMAPGRTEEQAPELVRGEAEEALASMRAVTERTLASVRTEAERALASLKVEAERSVAENAPRNREAAREAARAALQSETEETIASIRAAAEEAIDSIKDDAERMRAALREEASQTLATLRPEAAPEERATAGSAQALASLETTAEQTRARMRARVEETLAAMHARVDDAGSPGVEAPAETGARQPAADVAYDECEIRWSHGKHRGCFVAEREAPEAGQVARSPFVRWHGDQPPPESGALASAQEHLVGRLAAEGWEPYARGDAWYAQRLRRPRS